VFKVRSLADDTFYAVKILKKRFDSVEEADSLQEVRYLHQLQDCRHVIALHDVLYHPFDRFVSLVFELCDCNLYEYMKLLGGPISECLSLLLMYQLLTALDAMHVRGTFHRDVKPENCMISRSNFDRKLADFGSARGEATTTRPYTEYVSTRWYRAPECILTSGDYGHEVDIWAVGCILFECLKGQPLFPGRDEPDTIARINKLLGAPPVALVQRFQMHPNTHISMDFLAQTPVDMAAVLRGVSQPTIDLIRRMLAYDAGERIAAGEALAHPAFELLRAYEEMWTRHGRIGIFSAFVLTYPTPRVSRPTQPPVADGILALQAQPEPRAEPPPKHRRTSGETSSTRGSRSPRGSSCTTYTVSAQQRRSQRRSGSPA
jgi:renal tumor antigen